MNTKKGSLITILLSVLEAAFEILIPLCMARVIYYGIDVGNMGTVYLTSRLLDIYFI